MDVGSLLDHKVALGQGSGTLQRRERRGKEGEEGGEEKDKELTCIMKSESITQSRKIQKKQERKREKGSEGRRKEGGRRARMPHPQNPAGRVTTASIQVPGLLVF